MNWKGKFSASNRRLDRDIIITATSVFTTVLVPILRHRVSIFVLHHIPCHCHFSDMTRICKHLVASRVALALDMVTVQRETIEEICDKFNRIDEERIARNHNHVNNTAQQ